MVRRYGSSRYPRVDGVEVRRANPVVCPVSHYDVLGVSPDADTATLRRAFVAMARRHHPDRHVGAGEHTRAQAERRMSEVTEAWAVLGDSNRRRRYDQGLRDRTRRTVDQAARAGTASRANASSSAGRVGARSGSQGRHWRSYASPEGAATERVSARGQLLLMSPLGLVVAAGGCGLLGAIIGWPPFFGAALVCLIGAAAGFFLLPILAMTRAFGPRRGRGPKRSY